jgi:hypothetical protein
MPIQFSEPVDGKYHGEAVVLTGAVLNHEKLGRFAIDLPSLVYHKEQVTVDYNHDPNQILGYAAAATDSLPPTSSILARKESLGDMVWKDR